MNTKNKGFAVALVVAIIALLIGSGAYLALHQKGQVTDESLAAKKTQPSLTVMSAPTNLKVGEAGTWQVKINYPTNSLANSSFFAVWGDEQTSPVHPSYVGPNNTSGADDAAKFYHSYKTPGTYHPAFTAVNIYGQSATIGANVTVSDSDSANKVNERNTISLHITDYSKSGSKVIINGSGFSPDANIVSIGSGPEKSNWREVNKEFIIPATEGGTKITIDLDIPERNGSVSDMNISSLTVINKGGTGDETTIPFTIEKTQPVSNLKTYQNDSLGISFQYPISWDGPQVAQLSTGTEISFPSFSIYLGGRYNQNLGRTLTSLEQANQDVSTESRNGASVKQTTLAGLSGYEVTYSSEIGIQTYDIFLDNQNTAFGSISYKKSSQNTLDLEMVLHSLKFY